MDAQSQPAGGEPDLAGRRLVVDGMNVIGSRPDGWWHDRDAAMRDLVGRLRVLAQRHDLEVTVVLEGRPLRGLEEGQHEGVTVRWAHRSGRDAADDRIAELVEHDEEPSEIVVATADRELSERVESRGAATTSPKALRDMLDEVVQAPLGQDADPGAGGSG